MARLTGKVGGTMTSTAPVDLSSFEATQRWVDDAAAPHGGIDVLYNNASLPVVGPWDDLTVDQCHAGIRNELDLVFYPCEVAWPHLVNGSTPPLAAHLPPRCRRWAASDSSQRDPARSDRECVGGVRERSGHAVHAQVESSDDAEERHCHAR